MKVLGTDNSRGSVTVCLRHMAELGSGHAGARWLVSNRCGSYGPRVSNLTSEIL